MTTTTTVIGIDPGISGALAALDSTGNLVVQDFPTHTVRSGVRTRNELDLVGLATYLNKIAAAVDHVFIERVGAMPGQGVTSMFRFGYAAGAVEGVVAALGLPFSFVTPQTWQRTQGVGAGPDAARQRVTRLFPQYADELSRKRDQHRADAVLIARHGLAAISLRSEEPRTATAA